MRVYQRCFRVWYDMKEASKVVDSKVVSTVWEQSVTKLTSSTFFAWKFYITVCPAHLNGAPTLPTTGASGAPGRRGRN